MPIPEIMLISALGLCMVFVVLIILMCFIYVMSAVFNRKKAVKQPVAVAANVSNIIQEHAAIERTSAGGSCGEIKLYDVHDQTAAMLMAIVADELEVPLDELRFISIKEVEEESK